MPSGATLAVFCGAALLLLVVPGPSVMYIVARSASQGRRAGLVSVAGIHAGTVVHVVAALVGLSAVLAASATALTAVKMAGAAYLVYLGLRTILQHRRPGSDILREAQPRAMRRIFADAVAVNVLNPKTAVFFLAFVPQFVDPSRGNATAQLLALSTVFIVLGVVSDAAYACAGAWIGGRLVRAPRLARRTDLVAGSTYFGLGLATAVSGAKASVP